jgi:ketosteroid isomerase-like protein
MDTQQNKQSVQEAYQLFQSGDIRSLLERIHDDAEWISPESDFMPFAGAFRGKQGIGEFFAKLDANMQALRFEPLDLIAEGDKVVAIGRATWLAKPTGQQFDTPWVHIFTMRDGKVARFEAFADTAAGERAFRVEQQAGQATASTQLHH